MKIFNKILDNFAAALFLLMIIVVSVQIFFRFVLRIGIPWTEEISRLVFLYLAFTGGAVAVREGSMIVVDTFPLMLRGKARKSLDLCVDVFGLAFLLIMFFGGVRMAALVWPTVLSTVGWISNGWLYISLASSFGLMMVFMIFRIAADIRALARREKTEDRGSK